MRDHTDGKDVGFNFDYMAAKYIDKLIPVSQTIHLPSLRSQYDLGKEICLRVKSSVDGADRSPDNAYCALNEENFEKAIFDLIYEKTGMLFVKHEVYLHEIIPSTLRGYMHLYRFQSRMPRPESADDLAKSLENRKSDWAGIAYCERRRNSEQQKLRNLSMFEHYFLQDWIPSRIHEATHRKELTELQNVASSQLFRYCKNKIFNKKNIINTAADCPIFSIKYAQNEFPDDQSTDDGSLPSYSVFLNCLNKKRVLASVTEEYNYCFAIGTYVSMQLHKIVLSQKIKLLNDRLKTLTSSSAPKRESGIDDFFVFDYSRLTRIITGNDQKYKNNSRLSNEPNDTVLSGFISTITNSIGENWKGQFAEFLLRVLCEQNLFKIAAFSDNVENPIQVLDLEDDIVCFGCNWDVIHVMYDYVTESAYTIINGGITEITAILETIDNKLINKGASQGIRFLRDLLAKVIDSSKDASDDSTDDSTPSTPGADILNLQAQCDNLLNMIDSSIARDSTKDKWRARISDWRKTILEIDYSNDAEKNAIIIQLNRLSGTIKSTTTRYQNKAKQNAMGESANDAGTPTPKPDEDTDGNS